MIFKSIRFFSFGKVILSCVCTHTHNQNKRQSFTLYIYSVEYIIIWRDWMMLILKYFHITEMYFLFSPFQGMTNSSVQFSFLDVGTPFFFFSLGVFLGNIHNTYNQTRAAAYRSRQHSMRKKEIRRIKMNRPGRRRRKKKMMISHHCFQFWKETSSHFIRYFAIGPRRSIKKKNKRNGIRKSTLPPCFSSFVLLLSSLFFLVVSSEKKNTVFFLFCFNIFI